jgi:hypothetical protein
MIKQVLTENYPTAQWSITKCPSSQAEWEDTSIVLWLNPEVVPKPSWSEMEPLLTQYKLTSEKERVTDLILETAKGIVCDCAGLCGKTETEVYSFGTKNEEYNYWKANGSLPDGSIYYEEIIGKRLIDENTAEAYKATIINNFMSGEVEPRVIYYRHLVSAEKATTAHYKELVDTMTLVQLQSFDSNEIVTYFNDTLTLIQNTV